jgi:hypothetical protein
MKNGRQSKIENGSNRKSKRGKKKRKEKRNLIRKIADDDGISNEDVGRP